ncbi:unnamed protein product [Sphenostylis stenocarpa]|uniref:Uncharacterized protein n=1 Tax=Sphenostylis stenocarpa TaxID=92480 RepID=A0AA86S118_9FABA|nr:unnamed protein product [Sphenostylis stenocarpa]
MAEQKQVEDSGFQSKEGQALTTPLFYDHHIILACAPQKKREETRICAFETSPQVMGYFGFRIMSTCGPSLHRQSVSKFGQYEMEEELHGRPSFRRKMS